VTVSAADRLVLLAEDDWRARAAVHAARVDAWMEPHLERRRRGAKHPVDDFLFTYYPTRPGQLRRWHPGLGVALAGADGLAADSAYARVDVDGVDAVAVDPAHFVRRRDGLAWVEGLVRSSIDRPARLGCFGLHEWAMVYSAPRPDR